MRCGQSIPHSPKLSADLVHWQLFPCVIMKRMSDTSRGVIRREVREERERECFAMLVGFLALPFPSVCLITEPVQNTVVGMGLSPWGTYGSLQVLIL